MKKQIIYRNSNQGIPYFFSLYTEKDFLNDQKKNQKLKLKKKSQNNQKIPNNPQNMKIYTKYTQNDYIQDQNICMDILAEAPLEIILEIQLINIIKNLKK